MKALPNLTAVVALAGLAFSQTSAFGNRKLSQESLPSAQSLWTGIPASLSPRRATPPPATTNTWTGGGGANTNWSNASNWNNGAITTGENILINLTTAATKDDQNFTIGTLTLSHAGDSVTINNGVLLNVGGNISNAGTITLGGTNFGTGVQLQGNVTLSGGGTVTLSNSSVNFIDGAVTADTLTNQETIQGAGSLGAGQMTLVNSGTINANQTTALIIQDGAGATATNTGTLEATAGGTLRLQSTTFTNTGGTISANGSTLQVNNSTINGGNVTLTGASTLQLNTGTIHGGSTLTNSATGTIELVSGVNTLGGTINNSAGGAFKLDNGAVLDLEAGTYSQLGAVQVNGANFGTGMQLQGNVTLSGGTVTLSNSSVNFIDGAVTADTLTNHETIQGAGSLGAGQMTLVNSGTINANQTTALIIQDGAGATATNTGTLEATAGGTLRLQSTTFTNTGGTISANGSTLQVNNSTINGGNVTLTGASTLQLNTGTIHGGSTLTNSATGTIELVSGVNTLGGTINNSAGGAFKLDNGAVLDLEAGTYSQLGAVQVNGANFGTGVQLQGNVTLSGGTVTLSNSSVNFIDGAVGTDVLTNQETIQGAGSLGVGQMGLVNSGTIIANQTTPLIIQPSSTGFTNTGTLQVSSADKMRVTGGPFTNFASGTLTGGTYSVSGTLEIDELGTAGGEILTNAAKIILNGAGSSFVDSAGKDALVNMNANAATGAFTISGGRNFTTAANFNNLGTLTVGSGSAFTVTGTLAQISGTTLSGGTFVLGGNLNVGSGINLTTNSSTLTLQGGTIMSGTTNALAGLNRNTKSLTLANGANFTTVGNFTNSGTLAVNGGSTFAVISGSTLTNYNSTTKTLTGGTFTVGGTLSASGLDIQTDAANITLTGTGQLENSTTSTNALANLNSIASTGSLSLRSNANFTAAGNFTNSGKLTVNAGSTFGVTGTLTNLSAGTLTGGTYTVGGTMQLASGNGGITTNAANLTLAGTTAKILDGTSNALSTFNNNTGTFALATGAKLTTAATNFTNSGTVTIAKGTTLTVGGTGNSYNQSAGTTTVDGTLTGGGTTGVSVTGGTIQGAGTLKTNISVGAATIHVGDAGKAGLLNITGTYTQLSTGTMNVSIGGTNVGAQVSQLKITGAASLGGTLTAAVVNGFTPAVGQTFMILTTSSVSGTFTNSTIAINGTEHFNVSYTATSVVLTVASGAATTTSSTAAAASRMAIAATKPAIMVARPPIMIGGVRKIGGLVKLGKPILVAGFKREIGRSNAMVGREWEWQGLRTSQAAPVISSWNRNSVKTAPVSRMTSSSMRLNPPVSNQVVERNGVRVLPRTGMIGLSGHRAAAPIRMLPTHIPMMTTAVR